MPDALLENFLFLSPKSDKVSQEHDTLMTGMGKCPRYETNDEETQTEKFGT